MKIFEVTMKAWKVFFVEAESEDDALAHSVTEDEQDTNWTGRFDWEHDETSAKELGQNEADQVRNQQKHLLVLDSEHED